MSSCRTPPQASGNGSPDRHGSIEYAILANADSFFLGLGEAEEAIADEAIAFQGLLQKDDARDVFEQILREGTLEGQLYAVCAYYFLDRKKFNQLVKEYGMRTEKIRTEHGASDIGGLVSVSTIVSMIVSDRIPVELRKAIRPGGQGPPDVSGLLAKVRTGQADEEDVIDVLGERWHWRDTVPELIAAARGPEERSRLVALDSLGTLGPWGGDAASVVGQALNDPSPEVRLAAARALMRMSPVIKPALPMMKSTLARGWKEGEEEDELLESILLAMKRLGPDAALLFIEALKIPREWIREQALEYFSGLEAKKAETAIREAVRDESPEVRSLVEQALERERD